MSRTKNLAAFATNLQFEDLPPEVVTAGKRMLLDIPGCAVAATKWDPAKAKTAWVLMNMYGGKEESAVFGTDKKAPSILAAYANAALAHGCDHDDTQIDAVVHAGAEIATAALAVCEAIGASGKDLILAAIVGFEISLRVAKAVMPGALSILAK